MANYKLPNDPKKNAVIIGVDHGNAQIKTAACCFQTSIVEKSRINPGSFGILEYKNEFYTLKDRRLPVETNKAQVEAFFPLTLMAIAQELIARNPNQTDFKNLDIILAIGLPPSAFNAQTRKEWEDYFLNRMENITKFKFDQKSFAVRLIGCQCFMQGLMILDGKREEVKRSGMIGLLVDCGGYTTDIITMDTDPTVPVNEVFTLSSIDNLGMNAFYSEQRERIQNRFHHKVSPKFIARALDVEKKTSFSAEEMAFINEAADAMAVEIVSAVREHIPADYSDYLVYFCGGGSIALEKQIMKALSTIGKIDNIRFIRDVKANAKSYENACRKKLARG